MGAALIAGETEQTHEQADAGDVRDARDVRLVVELSPHEVRSREGRGCEEET